MIFSEIVTEGNTIRKRFQPKNALVLGTVAALLLGFTSPLWAADQPQIQQLMKLIEQQQAQIDALKAQVEALAKGRTEMAAQTAEAPAELPKGLVRSGNDKAGVKLYGQVNRGFLAADDGNSTKTWLVDNENSSTRIGLLGEVAVTDDLTAGSKIEVEFQSNPSNEVDQFNPNNVGDNHFKQRHLDFTLDSKTYGKIWLGQGDTATNNSAEVDLSGTAVVGNSSISYLAGGLLFYDSRAEGYPGVIVEDVFSNFDGLSRDDRLRYDTPDVHGFTLAGSVISGPMYDAALWYSRQFDGFKIAGAAGYAWTEELKSYENQLDGSLSILLDNGFNLTLAGGQRYFDADGRDDPFYGYGKLGYQKNFWGIGKTALSIDYGQWDDLGRNGDEAKTWGLQFVQNVDRWGTEFFLGYRWHDLDRPDADFDNIHAVLTGARLKF